MCNMNKHVAHLSSRLANLTYFSIYPDLVLDLLQNLNFPYSKPRVTQCFQLLVFTTSLRMHTAAFKKISKPWLPITNVKRSIQHVISSIY